MKNTALETGVPVKELKNRFKAYQTKVKDNSDDPPVINDNDEVDKDFTDMLDIESSLAFAQSQQAYNRAALEKISNTDTRLEGNNNKENKRE